MSPSNALFVNPTPRIRTLEDKYVRSTRFSEVSSGTAGQITLPQNSEVVLDDFGGTVDAIVSEMSGGRPTSNSAYTALGAVVATTFDSSGNYVLSGAPATYPVAIIYRVRQKAKYYDSSAPDIIGEPKTEAVIGPASAIDGNIATFDGPSGWVIKDSGMSISSITRNIDGGMANSNYGGGIRRFDGGGANG